MNHTLKHIITAAAIATALPATGLAQSEDLGSMNVTASRVETPSISSSKPVTIIDRDTIDTSHADNIVDLLKGQANIVVRDTSGIGAKSQVDLGGFGESAAANSVVLIDGRRINNPDLSGTDWAQIPLDQVERIEIVHGAESVLYGNGAVGGVINIITRIPEAGGTISMSGGSFKTGSGRARFGADSGSTRIEGNVSGLTTDGYRDNSFFDRFDGGARAEADLSDNLSLRIAGNHHRDRAGLPGSLTAAQVSANRKQANNMQDYSRTTDDYVDGGLNWVSDHIDADLAGGFRRRDVHSEFVSFSSTSDFVNRTASLRPKVSVSGGSDIRFQLIGGADIDRSNGSFAFGGAIATTEFKRKRDGFYGKAIISDADNRVNISGGARSERVRDDFRQTAANSISNRETAWDAGASVQLVEGLRLRANMARSIRFPLLDERFNFFFGTVNTALKAQTGRHYSGALRYEAAAAWIEVAASRGDLDQEIWYNPTTFANSNYTDKTRHDVLMVSGAWHAHDLLQLSANYTLSRATFRGGANNGMDIPAVPRNRAGIGWTAGWLPGLSTTMNAAYVGDSYLISDQGNVRPKLPAYFTVDAVVNYRWQDIEMFARVNNLTNRRYSSYGVYSAGFPPFVPASDNFYPVATASFRAGASYSF